MVERFSEYSGSFPAIPNDEGEFVRFSDYATLEAQLAGQETTLWARFKDILSALEATPPAPKVTATTDHDPKLGTTLHLMKQSWESRQPTNSGAPKVTEEMVDAGHAALGPIRQLYVSKDEIRAALTAAQEAGKP